MSDFSAIGAGLGGLLGATSGGGKPAGTTTTTTSSIQDLPDWLKPYVSGNLGAAQGTRDSLAGSSNGLFSAAMPEYMKTVRGDYLNPSSNPYLTSTFNTASDLVGSRINSVFEHGNRYGSGQQAGALGTANTALANDIFGGNYQAERARQMAAIGGAPNFALGHEQAAMYPYASFNSLIPTGLKSSSGTETNPYFTNPVGNALSSALAGGQLGGLLGMGGGIGDLLGGILGGGGGAGADAFGGFGGWAGLGGSAAETGGAAVASTAEEWLPALAMMFA